MGASILCYFPESTRQLVLSFSHCRGFLVPSAVCTSSRWITTTVKSFSDGEVPASNSEEVSGGSTSEGRSPPCQTSLNAVFSKVHEPSKKGVVQNLGSIPMQVLFPKSNTKLKFPAFNTLKRPVFRAGDKFECTSKGKGPKLSKKRGPPEKKMSSAAEERSGEEAVADTSPAQAYAQAREAWQRYSYYIYHYEQELNYWNRKLILADWRAYYLHSQALTIVGLVLVVTGCWYSAKLFYSIQTRLFVKYEVPQLPCVSAEEYRRSM